MNVKLKKRWKRKNKLDYSILKRKKNRLKSFQKFKKDNEKISNKLVKIIKSS
jgi:hypothetical protein